MVRQSRRRRLTFLIQWTREQLEDRTLPAPIPFSLSINDPTGEFAPFPAVAAAISSAQATLSSLFDGKGSIEVSITPDDQANRGGGGAPTVVVVGQNAGLTVVETGAEAEARSGVDPNGASPDIMITLNPVSYLPLVATGSQGVTNMTYILLHEAIHGLGMTGYRTVSGSGYGQIPGSTETVYDKLTSFGTGGDADILYFTGSQAEAIYGGPVPLTSQGAADITGENFYHVANPVGRPGDSLLNDLMNGIAFANSPPSALDLAILADLGWTLSTSAKVGSLPGSDTTPPQIVGITTEHVRRKINAIVISFDQAMDQNHVENLSLYHLAKGRKVRGSWVFKKALAIRSAAYDKSTHQLRLVLSKRYQGLIQISATGSGIVSELGVALAGDVFYRLK